MVTPAVPVEIGYGLSGFLCAKGNDLAQKPLKNIRLPEEQACYAALYVENGLNLPNKSFKPPEALCQDKAMSS
ncbi:hypothetical protein [Erwinia tasmaniensis]|uniref:Uncharacterized protein n=1 Tax=Erwinia tasmaniensis (strain DSM 17950 / CFBP 7177 / CIP 109463 / NCPPB 4357 / Et1/99) TaxID=465817 RepID=B2VC85_ERWT9|nr:hypothetical protein [Erwinia tasmaniensis]CAO97162.1 hypothetical protein ETA_21160 [Erwinia tasmaniensis Et1/99]